MNYCCCVHPFSINIEHVHQIDLVCVFINNFYVILKIIVQIERTRIVTEHFVLWHKNNNFGI